MREGFTIFVIMVCSCPRVPVRAGQRGRQEGCPPEPSPTLKVQSPRRAGRGQRLPGTAWYVSSRPPRIWSPGSAADLPGLKALIETQSPDVVVTDIRMPPTQTDEGIAIAAILRTQHPEMGVLLLSQYAEAGYALMLLADGTARRGTCSRSAWRTATSSRMRSAGWRTAGRSSTRR